MVVLSFFAFQVRRGRPNIVRPNLGSSFWRGYLWLYHGLFFHLVTVLFDLPVLRQKRMGRILLKKTPEVFLEGFHLDTAAATVTSDVANVMRLH